MQGLVVVEDAKVSRCCESFVCNLFRIQVGSVNLLVAARTGMAHGLHIVLSSKQIKIPHLWFAGHEELNRTGQQHLVIISTKGAVISSVDLVVNIFLSVQIFHHTAARYNSSDQALNALLRQQSFQIQQRNAIMAAQHIYGVDLMIAQFISPSGQVTAILIFNGVQHQPRQEEIIGHVAFICHCLVNFFAVRSFLRGLFMDGTLMTEIELNKRFQDLGLAVDALQSIHMVLAAAPQPADDTSWKPELFGYAFRNLATELLCENAPAHVFHFLRQDMHFCLAWLDGSLTPDIVAQRCRSLIELGGSCLRCEVTCYVTHSVSWHTAATQREAMEQRDRQNITRRGELILETDQLGPHSAAPYSLDVAKLEQLFAQGSVPAITNLIRKDLSTLAEEKMLSPALMQQIHQDFQQVLYSVLSANEIQAHELFRDDACVRLNQTAESSIMNMIKWVSVAADRAVRTIRETHQVNSIAGKIRQYCQEHFAEKISNREIADAVYLTPDYANRVFKDAYGLSIKDYLTDLRMQKAQLLLRDEANTISEVAAQVGFDNFSYFSTQFKKYTGLTPNEWKRQNG